MNNNNNTKEWEISKQILKAHLFKQVIDGCGEAEVIFKDKDRSKKRDKTRYYDDRNLDTLFRILDRLELGIIHINELKQVRVELEHLYYGKININIG